MDPEFGFKPHIDPGKQNYRNDGPLDKFTFINDRTNQINKNVNFTQIPVVLSNYSLVLATIFFWQYEQNTQTLYLEQ